MVALAIHGRALEGVKFRRYSPKPLSHNSEITALRDMESKAVRGFACAAELQKLQEEGFEPDVIVAHPGWGEALFCKDVFPRARLVMFGEFFYSTEATDYNFDPEFCSDTFAGRAGIRLKNSVHLHALHAADVVYSPTRWQAQQLPSEYQHKVKVIFDGIDTEVASPNPQARIRLARDGLSLTAQDEIITFVNRNLEPYRGFHIFMRALPAILKQRPKARCIILGKDQVSYGARPKGGGGWRKVLLEELQGQLPMDRVHFLGNVAYADYLRVLQVSTCHVYMTYPFVLSWSCLESMSVGNVVVGSRTGPVTEVIEDGFNGRLFDFFDTEALTRQVVEVLAEPQRYKHLGINARASVMQRYDLKRICLPAQLELLLG